MKLLDIVKNVGSAIISNVVPGGGMIVDVINDLLPDDQKLSKNATGSDINNAISKLPPEDQARIMEKEFDVDMTQIKESHSTVRAMLESDVQNQHTTRPYIAKQSFHVIAVTIVITVLMWAYGVYKQDSAMVKEIMDGWQFILAIIAPLVVLLHAYFGVLRSEHKNKLDAANGAAVPSGLTGLISSILKR